MYLQVKKELEKAKQEERALRDALIVAKDEEKKRQNQVCDELRKIPFMAR